MCTTWRISKQLRGVQQQTDLCHTVDPLEARSKVKLVQEQFVLEWCAAIAIDAAATLCCRSRCDRLSRCGSIWMVRVVRSSIHMVRVVPWTVHYSTHPIRRCISTSLYTSFTAVLYIWYLRYNWDYLGTALEQLAPVPIRSTHKWADQHTLGTIWIWTVGASHGIGRSWSHLLFKRPWSHDCCNYDRLWSSQFVYKYVALVKK